ncbi:MAG: hypothetical protein IJ812_00270 [Schwartzia sp.]|nr:hypothetical protein [Schwartzia sp. (in: firmicutes)]
MKIRFNATGAQRKALVKAIAEITGADFRYLGVPSLCYEVDCFTIDRKGTLIFDNSADTEEIGKLLEGLAERGFVAEDTDNATASEENGAQEQEAAQPETEATPATTERDSGNEAEPVTPTADDSIGLTLSLPVAGFDGAAYQNLCNLLNGKASLIKKALGIEDLPVKVDEKKISFPWFDKQPDADVAKAAMELVAALCRTAKELTRVTAKARMVPNEKYAFRFGRSTHWRIVIKRVVFFVFYVMYVIGNTGRQYNPKGGETKWQLRNRSSRRNLSLLLR